MARLACARGWASSVTAREASQHEQAMAPGNIPTQRPARTGASPPSRRWLKDAVVGWEQCPT